jgi:hypothetical protein
MTLSEGSEKLARALLLPINPAVVVLLGIFTTVWGFWVANPWWTVFTQAPLFDALNTAWFVNALSISPEVFWGVTAMACGVMITYGAVKRSYKSLIRGATIATLHWATISIYFFMGDWANTGGITAGLFATYGAFLWLNIRVNFKDTHNMDDVLRK